MSRKSLPQLSAQSSEIRRRTKSLYVHAAKISRQIDAQLEADRKAMEKVIRLLLLGPSESGKTTVVKQMQIIHLNGYSLEELLAMRPYIFANVVMSLTQLLRGVIKLGFEFPPDYQEDADYIISVAKDGSPLDSLNDRLHHAVKRLWESEQVQHAYVRRNEFQLVDCAKYFLDAVADVARPDYCPSQRDILNARTKTTGVNELHYTYNDKELVIVDVAGQRSQRRKWISLFDNVNAVLFIAAISEYDQRMYEDDEKNRLLDALELFAEIGNHAFFERTQMILFLNKKDIFEEKITRVSLKICFPTYKWKNDYKNATAYITKKFARQIKDKNKAVYTHLTCATDTDQIRFVTNSVTDMVIKHALQTTGMA